LAESRSWQYIRKHLLVHQVSSLNQQKLAALSSSPHKVALAPICCDGTTIAYINEGPKPLLSRFDEKRKLCLLIVTHFAFIS